MSDLQSAIAGLNTVDIEGDPIDALDACLMVMETMADVPKSGGGNRPLNMPHDALSVNTVVEPIKIKVYGWKAVEMARNLSFKQLEILREKTQKEHLIPNDRRSDIHVYDQKGLKKLDVLNWAVHHKLIEFKRNPNGSDKPLDTEDQSRVRAEFQRNYEQGLYDSVDGFDSIAFDLVDFDELDVENDPIDALDACLMVLELLQKPATMPDDQSIIPKYEFTEKVTPAARQRANNEAIAILRSIQKGQDGRVTDEQKAKLSRYTGTGGNLVGEDGLTAI